MPKSQAPIPLGSDRPEAQLLLACARTALDADTARRIKALVQAGMDWEYVLQKTEQHCILPLLYASLETACQGALPEPIASELRRRMHDHVLNNLFLTGELVKLLNLFEAHGIPALPYKGPLLAASVYGGVSQRVFWDLDILVRKQDVIKTKKLLLSRGYRMQDQFADAENTAKFLAKKKDYRFVHDAGGVVVELHWRLTGKNFFLPFGEEAMWARLKRRNFAGSKVLSLPPEDLALILCVHGAKHCFARLEWICDVAELIRSHQEIDWARVIRQARKQGSERMVLLGLFLAMALLGAELPEAVRQRVESDSLVRALASQVREALFREPGSAPGAFEDNAYRIMMRDRWWDRLRLSFYYFLHYLRTRLTPNERDRAVLPLPDFLSFLYYMIRPVRLTAKYGVDFLKSLKSS